MMKYLILAIAMLHSSFAGELLPLGSQAKKFYIPDLNNQRQGYKNYFEGQTEADPKLTILSFWSTSCIPCRKEMPELEKITSQMKDIRLVFVNLDGKSDKPKVLSFLKKYGIQGTVLLDSYQTTGKNYQVCEANSCSVPTLYGMDSKGTIVLAQTGYDPNTHDLKSIVTEALSKATSNLSQGNSPSTSAMNFSTQIECEAALALKHKESAIAKKYEIPLVQAKSEITSYIQKKCAD